MNTTRAYDFECWGGGLPKVSCICITYGRPHLIGEAVQSFLLQDYPGEKELIILNDHPGILLEIGPHPEITLVNRIERYPTIGSKRNAATRLSTGRYILPWDDDDISLPWRISLSLQKIRLGRYFKPSTLWWWNGRDVERKDGVMAHAMSIYSREMFDTIGGYPEFNSGEDQEFEAKVAGEGCHSSGPLESEDIFYIYRMMGIDTYHLSYHGYGKGLEECARHVENQGIQGRHRIIPKFQSQYVELAENKAGSMRHCENMRSMGLSICVSLKNRSRVPHGGGFLNLFPNCVDSICRAARDRRLGPLEIIVADFGSSDWAPEDWLAARAAPVPVRIVRVPGGFSRGRGLNRAAAFAKHSIVLLADADLVFEVDDLMRGIDSATTGNAAFPVILDTDERGNPTTWHVDAFGICFVRRELLGWVGGVPEFESWGGEDNILHNSLAKVTTIDRYRSPGIRHQWHPEACRHECHSRSIREDFSKYHSTPGERSGFHPENSTRPGTAVRCFAASHPQWNGTLLLFSDGTLIRPGIDLGTYEISDNRLILKWFRWKREDLIAADGGYLDPTKDFRLREIDPPFVSKGSADDRAGATGRDRRYVFVLGSGRCGTMSLASMLSMQEGVMVSHERLSHRVTWEASETVMREMIAELHDRTTHEIVGDSGFYWLNYVSLWLDLLGSDRVRFPVLKRPMTETVSSYLRWTGERDHWSDESPKPCPWDSCYPSYPNRIPKTVRVARFWKQYYSKVIELEKRFPHNVRIFSIRQMNTEAGRRRILKWCGVKPTRPPLAIHVNRNREHAPQNAWALPEPEGGTGRGQRSKNRSGDASDGC